MGFSIIYIFLLIHIVLFFIYAVLIFTRRSSLSTANLIPIFCIPLFGITSAIIADYIFFNKKEDPDTEDTIETLSLTEDIYWKSIKKREQAKNVVPLEEALIVNDRQTRKKLIFETLLEDPMKNLDILLLARENNDADTAHYANTTIAKIQRDFQLKIQKLAYEYESDQDNIELLNKYIETLRNFINSGLSESFLLIRQRIVLANLLERKISLEGWDRDTLLQKIMNSLELKDINPAIEANEILKQNLPDDEQTWINALRISVAGHDTIRLKETIDEIKEKQIEWTTNGKEQVSAWIEI
jgi:hypothetical protein